MKTRYNSADVEDSFHTGFRGASPGSRGGRMVRRCWVNFQCWGVLLIWIIGGQGPIALAVGADGVV